MRETDGEEKTNAFESDINFCIITSLTNKIFNWNEVQSMRG